MRFPQIYIEKMLYNCSLVSWFYTPVCLFSTAKEVNLLLPSSYKSFFIPLVIIALLYTPCRLGPPKLFPILEDNSVIYAQNYSPSIDRVLWELYSLAPGILRWRKSLTWHFGVLLVSSSFRNDSGKFFREFWLNNTKMIHLRNWKWFTNFLVLAC